MKISLDWLADFIDIGTDITVFADKITDAGLEVEGIEDVEEIKGGLKGLVIGEVVEHQKHPNADKLFLTKVNVGSTESLSIVCGAPNVAMGQKVVVAQVGCTLYPANGGSFKIKKSKIRGEVSEGMICAEDEIGLGNAHDGIMVLPTDCTVGQAFSEYKKIDSDTVIEIGITPNRGDATSHFGVAREWRAISGKPVCFPPVCESFKGKEDLSINIENKEDCTRYVSVVLDNISIKPSPNWMQKRLKSIGINPKNNVVDITNYVLHELGHPIHAFDADAVKGNEIWVRKAKKGEKITTLDEEERELSEIDLLICDSEKPLAIAGVFGGIDSGVTDKTTKIIIESAWFDASLVRATAKRFALNTDASFRFERGADPEICKLALQRVVYLMCEHAGASVKSVLVDEYPNPKKPFEVSLRLKRLNQLAGIEYPKEEVVKILKGLEIEICEDKNEVLATKVPRYRSDVMREVDLIEEVIRIFGMDKIPIKNEISYRLNQQSNTQYFEAKQKITQYLNANGYHEMMSSSLTSADNVDLKQSVELQNPLSKDIAFLRTQMEPSVLQSIALNLNRKNMDVRLFEFGKTYHNHPKHYYETQTLAIGITGNVFAQSWETEQRKADVFYLKNHLQNLFELIGVTPTSKNYTLHQVDDQTLKKFSIKKPVAIATINLDKVLKKSKTKLPILPSKYPEMERELSLVLNKKITFEMVEKEILKNKSELLLRYHLIDVYAGKPLAVDEQSFAISFDFGHDERTLNDKEIDEIMKNYIQEFEEKLNAVIRR